MPNWVPCLIPLLALALASPSWAERGNPKTAAPDYARPGWYAGVGAGGAWDFLESAVEDVTSGAVEINGTGSFNARLGYRITSWFAFETMYEGNYRFPTELAGVKVGELSTHSILGNLKFILPTWRIQPYLALGPGAQYGKFDSALGVLDTTRWDFVLRLGLGVDGYITENWVVNLEVAPSVRFADYSNIPKETTDNVSLTFGAGLQYRF